jgi:hypothetical protein
MAIDKFGSLDILVSNAGIGYFAAIEERKEEKVRPRPCSLRAYRPRRLAAKRTNVDE